MTPSRRSKVARWWDDQPGAAVVGKLTAVAATTWTWADGEHETSGDAAAATHTISVCLNPIVTEFALDGRRTFAGEFRPGMLALIPAGSRPWAVQFGGARKLHLAVPHALIRDALAQERNGRTSADGALSRVGVLHDPVAARLCRRILATLNDPRAGSAMLFDALALELAVHMARQWTAGPAPSESATPRLAPAVLSHVLEAMRADLVGDSPLSDLAIAAGLSPTHFCRAFRASTGKPPHKYLSALRLERAADLLATTRLSIADIAASVGYDDPGYFARMFRRGVGLTPSVYRRELRR
jgi:AraC family transcriptional regulator